MGRISLCIGLRANLVCPLIPARPVARAAAALLVVLIGAACASHTHLPRQPGAVAALQAGSDSFETSPDFAYRPAPVEVGNHVLDGGSQYVVRRLSYPSHGDNGRPGNLVTVDFHQSQRPGRWPAVIVLPIWGVNTYPSREITSHLVRHSGGSMHVFELEGETYLLAWDQVLAAPDQESFMAAWELGVGREKTIAIDIRRLIDWAGTRPEIDSGAIGLIGFSHSAIVAATLALQEPRVSATVLVMGGVHPHEVIAHCDGRRTANVQRKAEEEYGWSREELASRLEPIFSSVDPAEYAGRVDPTRVLMFEAGRDPCISPSNREALWHTMGRPELYTIDANHRKAFLAMSPLGFNWMQRRILDFFERVLAPGPGR